MQGRPLLLALALTGGLAAAGGAGRPWLDVLDAPAVASPFAQRGLLNGLARAGERVVAVGQRGHIVFSDDAGVAWKQAKVPASADLVAVHFTNDKLGWAVGHDGIVLHSNDGGANWQRQRDGRADGPRGAENPLLDVTFLDARNGYAVGAFGTALRTEDGGVTWRPIHTELDNPKSMHLYTVRAAAATVFMAGEQGLVLKLDAATGRFRALETPYKGTFFGLVATPTAIVAHGLRGNVVRSTDAGASWHAVPTNVPAGLTAGATDARGRIVLASQAGHLVVSHDEGATFASLRATGVAPAAAVLASRSGLVVAGPRGAQVVALP